DHDQRILLSLDLSAVNIRPLASSSCRLSQASEGNLVIEDCLIKRRPLRNERSLRVNNFINLCFARTVTGDRSSHVFLGFDHPVACQGDATCGTNLLSLRRVEQLRETAQREGPLIFRNFDTEIFLAFAATGRAPIKYRYRERNRGRDPAVFFQSRTPDRVGVDSTVERIREGRQTICTGYLFSQPRRPQLSIELSELRAAPDIFRLELLIFQVNRQSQRQIGGADRTREVVAYQN